MIFELFGVESNFSSFFFPYDNFIFDIDVVMCVFLNALYLTDGQEIHRGRLCQPHPELDQKQRDSQSPVLQHHPESGQHGHHARVRSGRGRICCVCHQLHQPHVSIWRVLMETWTIKHHRWFENRGFRSSKRCVCKRNLKILTVQKLLFFTTAQLIVQDIFL